MAELTHEEVTRQSALEANTARTDAESAELKALDEKQAA